MTQAIQFNGCIEGCRTRQDKSLGLTVGTSELTSEEKMIVMDLQDIACAITVRPLDDCSVTREIKTELSKKTQSERIRGALYVWWHQLGEPGQFEQFYHAETDKFIEQIKSRLKPI